MLASPNHWMASSPSTLDAAGLVCARIPELGQSLLRLRITSQWLGISRQPLNAGVLVGWVRPEPLRAPRHVAAPNDHVSVPSTSSGTRVHTRFKGSSAWKCLSRQALARPVDRLNQVALIPESNILERVLPRLVLDGSLEPAPAYKETLRRRERRAYRAPKRAEDVTSAAASVAFTWTQRVGGSRPRGPCPGRGHPAPPSGPGADR